MTIETRQNASGDKLCESGLSTKTAERVIVSAREADAREQRQQQQAEDGQQQGTRTRHGGRVHAPAEQPAPSAAGGTPRLRCIEPPQDAPAEQHCITVRVAPHEQASRQPEDDDEDGEVLPVFFL